MSCRRSILAFLILVIAMAGFAPVVSAKMPMASDMSAKAMSAMPNCHEQMADEKADTTSPCKTDAACAAMCIMHAFQLSVFDLSLSAFPHAEPLPAPMHDLVSRTYGPDIRPPIV